ncbi:SDR family oxidoreductase [Arthrobacter ginsengisoli]|uniref:SDR family oxidoreductase n=1 Tax=Arthrobacter ginsengisoli TaxID=1356565 RepID=UPI0035B517FE
MLIDTFARSAAPDVQAYKSIIIVSSIAAELVSTDRSQYNVTKSALSMVTKLFAKRLAEYGIHRPRGPPGTHSHRDDGLGRQQHRRRLDPGRPADSTSPRRRRPPRWWKLARRGPLLAACSSAARSISSFGHGCCARASPRPRRDMQPGCPSWW